MDRTKFQDLQNRLAKLGTINSTSKHIDETLYLMSNNITDTIHTSLESKLKIVDDKFSELERQNVEITNYVNDIHALFEQFTESITNKIESVDDIINNNVELQKVSNKMIEDLRQQLQTQQTAYNEKLEAIHTKLRVLEATKTQTMMLKDIDLKKIRSPSVLKK